MGLLIEILWKYLNIVTGIVLGNVTRPPQLNAYNDITSQCFVIPTYTYADYLLGIKTYN